MLIDFSETNNFVEVLFESLVNHSYLPQPIVEITTKPPEQTSPPEKKPRKVSVSEELSTGKAIVEVRCIYSTYFKNM